MMVQFKNVFVIHDAQKLEYYNLMHVFYLHTAKSIGLHEIFAMPRSRLLPHNLFTSKINKIKLMYQLSTYVWCTVHHTTSTMNMLCVCGVN